MTKRTVVLGFVCVLMCGAALYAQQPVTLTPVPREGGWVNRHTQQVANMEKGDAKLLMIGDSITQGWEGGGKDQWEARYAKRHALNLGISGDRTEHVLWRLDNLPFDKIQPRAAVIMIGTNNVGRDNATPLEIAEGIKAIVEKLQAKAPGIRIAVLHVFPRDAQPDGVKRKEVNAINELFPPLLKDMRNVRVVDINKTFLDDRGVLTKEIMPDALHPNAHGYILWAEAMEPTIVELLEEKP